MNSSCTHLTYWIIIDLICFSTINPALEKHTAYYIIETPYISVLWITGIHKYTVFDVWSILFPVSTNTELIQLILGHFKSAIKDFQGKILKWW